MPKIKPDHEQETGCIIDARAGDFSTMPNPFTWDESAKFAHIIDGYGVAGGVEQCQEITNNAADNEPDPNDRAGSALTLWAALFGEHRRHRHSGYPPGPEAGLYLDALCEELGRRLRDLDQAERQRVRAVIAEHPGYTMRGSTLG
jgi:hypothetical protein